MYATCTCARKERNELETRDEYRAGRKVLPDARKPSPPPRPVLPPQLRIWPLVMLLSFLCALRIVPGFFESMSMPLMMAQFMGPPACVGLILCLVAVFEPRKVFQRPVRRFNRQIHVFLSITPGWYAITVQSIHRQNILMRVKHPTT